MNWDHNLEEPFWYYLNNPLEDVDEWERERVESEDVRERERALAVEQDPDYWVVYEDDPYEDQTDG